MNSCFEMTSLSLTRTGICHLLGRLWPYKRSIAACLDFPYTSGCRKEPVYLLVTAATKTAWPVSQSFLRQRS